MSCNTLFKHPCDPPGDPDGDRDPDLGGGDDLDGEEEEDEDESASAMAANIAGDRELKALPVVLLFKSNFQAFLNRTRMLLTRSADQNMQLGKDAPGDRKIYALLVFNCSTLYYFRNLALTSSPNVFIEGKLIMDGFNFSLIHVFGSINAFGR